MTKTQACRKHFKARALERYGLELNRHDLRDIAKMIQRNSGQFIEKQSNRITVWEVTYKDTLLRVVYDKNRKVVVTALPFEEQDDNGWAF